MSLWWMWGTDATSVGDPEVNYPSLWSGGVEWNAADIGDGTQGYWQTSSAPAARTGAPDISIAVAGAGVTGTIHSASWQQGRDGYFSVLTPASASFEVEGAVTFDPMDDVVIALMSDTTDEHSDALWVGYVDSVNETHETSGRIVTNVSCVDIIGVLGQATAPVMSFDVIPSPGVNRVIELVIAAVGRYITVEAVDPTNPTGGEVFGTSDGTDTALGLINKIEADANTFIVQRGARLGSVVKSQEYEPTPVTLDGAAGLSDWSVSRSPTTVINEWRANGTVIDDDIADDQAADEEASREVYGVRSFDFFQFDTTPGPVGPGIQLRGSGAFLETIPLLSGARLHVTDLSQEVLSLFPADWVTVDGTTYVVMSVSHSVEPGRRWEVSITGDHTIQAIQEAFA